MVFTVYARGRVQVQQRLQGKVVFWVDIPAQQLTQSLPVSALQRLGGQGDNHRQVLAELRGLCSELSGAGLREIFVVSVT